MKRDEIVLKVNSLSKRYGSVQALDKVSLTIHKGEVVCLVGPNGAGKTTLVETVLGLREPDEGEVELFGLPVRGRLPVGLARRVGAMLEDAGFLPSMSVRNCIRVLAEMYDIPLKKDTLVELMSQVGLSPETSQLPYKHLSLGQKRRVELAAALVTDPELLILDDPFLGLDPAGRIEILNTLRVVHQGRTIFYTTHYLDLATRFADQVLMLMHGRIRERGTPAELIQRYGGKWRLQLSSPSPLPDFKAVTQSGLYVKEVESLSELVAALQTLVDRVSLMELYVEPPTLQDVFQHLLEEEEK